MKRNERLLKAILEYVEEHYAGERGIRIDAPDLLGYSQKEIDYHVHLASESGWIRVADNSDIIIMGLTNSGHDALGGLRDEN